MATTCTPVYCAIEDVFAESGYTREMVMRVTGKSSDEVDDLINGYICSSQRKIRELLSIPHIVPREIHIGTGEDDEFDLGPEDEEYFIDEPVADKVEEIKHCFFGRRRQKRPYPRDCDIITEDISTWDQTGYCAPQNATGHKKAGNYAMKFEFGIGGNPFIARYPDVTNDSFIDKNIDIYDFMFFWVRASVAGATLTIRLYNTNGQYNEGTYTIPRANHWYKVMLDLDVNFTSTVDWDDDTLMWFTISTNMAGTYYIDNLNFNDEWCFTAPSGKLIIMHRSDNEPPSESECFYVTYTYDPFKVSVPENIRSACAQFAGVKLIDHFIGVREGAIAFEFMAETMVAIPDKETLYHNRGSMLAKAKANLNAFGYGWEGTVVR